MTIYLSYQTKLMGKNIFSKNKKNILFSLLLIFSIFSFSLVSADANTRGKYWTDPIDILDNVAAEANEDFEIQETALDNVTDMQGSYARQFKIANTLDWIRQNISPYLQWMVYIGLSIAVILVIYNGLLLVTGGMHKEWEIGKIKNNLMNIGIWVLILTGFYAILKLIMALMTSLFGWFGGDTGF